MGFGMIEGFPGELELIPKDSVWNSESHKSVYVITDVLQNP